MADFPYCKYDNAYAVCNCNEPCLTVTLSNSGNTVTVTGLVDSGCTVTLVEASLAIALGIDLSICPKTKVGGVGGKVDGWMSEIDFIVEGFAKAFSSPVIFVENLPVSTLLGQLNFFEAFNIHFQKSKYLFTLENSNE
jgi:predicted aspartyl protease